MDKKTKLYTLMFLMKPNQILLGMKKRGFGSGKYNGFGGKVEAGETIEQAAIRETVEECGLKPLNVTMQGCIRCQYDCEPDVFKVYIFASSEFEGELRETEEMRPEWFETKAIPFQSMWADVQLWMGNFLQRQVFISDITFIGYDKIHSFETRLIAEPELHAEMAKDSP